MDDVLSAGHRVTGLARSMAEEEHLVAGGASVIQDSLDDIDILREAAATADAVIHTAFNHDFSKFLENAAQDQRAIEILGGALEGSNRPLLVTSGFVRPAKGATETDLPRPIAPRKSEAAETALAARRVRAGRPTGWRFTTDSTRFVMMSFSPIR